jgi:hypothetical protein
MILRFRAALESNSGAFLFCGVAFPLLLILLNMFSSLIPVFAVCNSPIGSHPLFIHTTARFKGRMNPLHIACKHNGFSSVFPFISPLIVVVVGGYHPDLVSYSYQFGGYELYNNLASIDPRFRSILKEKA